MKLKLLLLYLSRPSLYPGFLSGGERHFIKVFRNASSTGSTIEVVAPPTGRDILEEYDFPVKVHQVAIPLEKRLDRWSNLGLSLVYLLRILRSLPLIFSLPRHYHLIVTTSHFLPDILPAVLIRRRNPQAKLIVYLHHLEPVPWKARGRALHGRILSWGNTVLILWLTRRYAHKVITVNPKVKEELIGRGIPEEKIHVFPNGVDMAGADAATRGKAEYEACYFGRLAPTKGITDIIDIWDDIRESYPGAKAAIIGGNGKGYVSQLRQKITEKKLENNISLLGVVPETKKYALIKSCQISISPSYEEGWGIALCETMACGLPVVAYDLPVYHIFGDEALIKVPVGDKKAFAKAILRLLSDKSLRDSMAQKAREVAARFSWEEVAKAELKLFYALAQQNRNEKK